MSSSRHSDKYLSRAPEEVEVMKRLAILDQEDLTDDEEDNEGYGEDQLSLLSRPNMVSRDSTFGSTSTTPPRDNHNHNQNSPTTTNHIDKPHHITNRDRNESIVTVASQRSTASKRKRRIAKMGQRAASLKFSALDFVALSPDKLKQHYKMGKLLHRGGSHSRTGLLLVPPMQSSSRSFGSAGGGGGGTTGSGSNGLQPTLHANIHVCMHRETGIQRAVKVVKKCHRWNRRHGHRTLQEFKILQSLDHPNLLKMYEMFEGTDHYYIIMDLCKGGDLADELDAWGSLEEHDAALLIKQVLSCLSYCHTNQIVHGNIKPEHILLEPDKGLDQIKLTDFSCAEILEPDANRVVEDENENDNNNSNNNNIPNQNNGKNNDNVHPLINNNNNNNDDDDDDVGDSGDDDLELEPDEQDQEIYHNTKKKIMPERKGTPDYWAPEVVLKGSAGPKRDIWAVGVLAHLVLSNKFPFAGATQEDVCERIIRGEFRLDDNLEDDDDDNCLFNDSFYASQGNAYYDNPAVYLEGGGSDEEPFQWSRVSSEAKDFIRYLLTWDEDKRPTARQALEHPWIVKYTKANRVCPEGTRFGEQGDEFVNSLATMAAWNNVAKFNAPNKLKQATCTFIAAQLVLKHEREAIDHVFRALDIYNDGRLSKKEVRIGYKECFGRDLTDDELEDLFSRVDLNGSGYIEYSEFLVAAMNEKDLLHSQKIQQAFSVFDRDNNGRISKEDLREVLSRFKYTDRRNSLTKRAEEAKVDIDDESLTKRAEPEETKVDIDDEIIDKIIREVDLAGSGDISYEEFLAMMLKTTDEVDADVAMEENSEGKAASTKKDHRKATMSIDSACSAENVNALKFTTGDVVAHRPCELTAHYDIEDFIDEGGFGKVYVCKHKATGAERAVKVINKSRWHKNENRRVLDEFELLKELDHPNILKMYDLFKDRHHYYIVMDVCKGLDLCDELDTWGKLTEIDAAILMKQLLSCMDYCHKKKIIHRDLKPENILIEQNKEVSHIKIIDFGLASRVQDGVEMTQRVGTAEYMAPEVVNRSYFGVKCDIWSCGVICYICLSDRFPFYARNQEDLYKAIMLGEFSFVGGAWEHVSEEAKDFIRKLLTWGPKDRPTAEMALQHPWLERVRISHVGNNLNLEVTNDAYNRPEEQRAANVSAMSALANLQKFTSVSKLKTATQVFIASQLLLKEEKVALDEVFRDLDLSCNGKLSRAEVKAAYFKYFGHCLSEEELDGLFARVDTGKTGFIDYSEFIVAAMNEKVLLSDKKLRKAFELFDKDGNGLICASDLKEALSFFCNSSEKQFDDTAVQNLIEQMDRDGDGFVSYDEFVAMMLLSADEGLGDVSVSEEMSSAASF